MKAVDLKKRDVQKPLPIAPKVSKPKRLALEWVESEYFEVWMRGARDRRIRY